LIDLLEIQLALHVYGIFTADSLLKYYIATFFFMMKPEYVLLLKTSKCI